MANLDTKVVFFFFYEFLCPVSNYVYMIYKYDTTFNKYDFTHKIVNLRLRLTAQHSSGEWTIKKITKDAIISSSLGQTY